MSKVLKRVLGLAAAAAGVYVVGKYIHDYTDYKIAEKKDIDALKAGGEKAKDAAKRTYIAIKTGNDVTAPAGELGTAVAEVAGDAGKIVSSAGNNAKNFAESEKEKYKADPAGYRAQVAENFRDMGQQAAAVFDNLKEDANDIISDIRQTADNFRYNPDDFVESEAVRETGTETGKEPAEAAEEKEEPLYTGETAKVYAEIPRKEVKEPAPAIVSEDTAGIE